MDGWIGLDGLSYTTVTPRASLQSDAKKGDFMGQPFSTAHGTIQKGKKKAQKINIFELKFGERSF